MDEYAELVERAVASKRTVVLFGGLDSGKTTLSKTLIRAGLAAGRSPAYLDADPGQKSVGPPTTVGLRMISSDADLEPDSLSTADAQVFVGATTPQGNLLPLVTGAARLQAMAFERGADFVVVDTSGLVSGVYGQLLKYHKVESLRPELVVGLQRGEELDPLLGIIRRFFETEVVSMGIHPSVVPTSVDQRAANREGAIARYFTEPLQRYRVKPTVFMPALPAFFDLTELDRLVVGLADGVGGYLGIGYLEHSGEEGILRLISPVAEAPKALRLGSVRVDEEYRAKRMDLRNLLGTD
ncbi:MAG TPA: Clp1/GlmU family protein [Actinomycetota bacterium]